MDNLRMEDSEDVLEEMIAELDQQVIKLCFDDPRTTAGGGVDSIPAVKAKRDECRERLYQLQENRREAEAAEARRREQERMAATNRPATAPPQKAREPVSKVTVDMMRTMGASEIRARAIAEDVMAFADGGDSVGNGIASRSELEGGLEGTKYDHFKGWMFARGGKRFMKYDDDGSGTISVLEMQLLVTEYLAFSEEMVAKTEKALRVVCTRMNDQVAELTNQGVSKTAAWFSLFKTWDEDGSMTICYEEFHDIVRRQLGVKKTGAGGLRDHEVQDLWNAIDVSEDNSLTVEEVG
mmetsp:Transcript_51521/g.144038  ORF Transcript_51521/g.144038 Transcript_51521/m.144038 type:complete len:295 (+) Transcript_51521:164-1048(+)